MKYLYLLLICVVFIMGICVGKVYFPKTITKEIKSCNGYCYPKDFDLMKFCEGYYKEVLKEVPDKPVSFEVFADEFDEMEGQAKIIASWGKNVYVKIPIINTKGEGLEDLIEELSESGIKINVTAITLWDQALHIRNEAPMIFSFFAGRIADTGLDPILVIKAFIGIYAPNDNLAELLWASTREVLNIYQAEQAGADIITCTPELLEKYYKFKEMDLEELSLITVKQFYEDAKASGFQL